MEHEENRRTEMKNLLRHAGAVAVVAARSRSLLRNETNEKIVFAAQPRYHSCLYLLPVLLLTADTPACSRTSLCYCTCLGYVPMHHTGSRYLRKQYVYTVPLTFLGTYTCTSLVLATYVAAYVACTWHNYWYPSHTRGLINSKKKKSIVLSATV